MNVDLTKQFVEWARMRAVRLARGEDTAPPDAPADDGDLAPFAAMVGSARAVAIGETFHHTHDLLAMRERLVRYLVERLGFRTIVLEVVRPGPNAIDDYVVSGTGDGETALVSTGARMWRNRETLRIVDWVAAFNRTHGHDPVRIVGMDLLAPGASMRAVIEQVDMPHADRLRAWSRGFDVDGRDDQVFYNAMAVEDRTLLRDAFRIALETLEIDRAEWQHRIGAANHALLLEQTIVVLQALRTLEVGTGGWSASLAFRDKALAESVARLLDGDAQARLIILSHNMHINALGPARQEGQPAPVALGIFLRERYGNAYLAVGTAYGEAHFDPAIYGVSEAPGDDRDSIDQLIAEVAEGEPLLLDLRGEARPAYLEGPARMQATGSGPGSHVRHDPIGLAYDVLAFVPRVGNAVQLVETDLNLDIAAIDKTRRVEPAAG